MAEQLGDVQIGVVPTNDPRAARRAGESFAKDVGRGAEARSRSIGGKFATGLVAGMGVGLTQQLPGMIGSFARELFGLAEGMEQIDRRAGVVFGGNLERVTERIDTLNESLGLSRNQALGAAAGIQDILVPMGFARDAAADMTLDFFELGGAMAGNTGGTRTAAEAHQALTAAINGEREQLKAYGVVLTEEIVKQRAAENASKGMTFATEQQAKAVATLQLATEQSSDAISLWNDRSGTMADKANQARARFQEAKETLARELMPVMLELVGGAATAAQALGDMVGFVTANKTELAALGAVIATYKFASNFDRIAVGAFNAAGRIDQFTAGVKRSLQNINPWGVALGAAVLAVGAFIQHKKDQERAIQQVADALRDETRELDDSARATTEAMLASDTQLRAMEELGITYDMVTEAANGNTEAQDALTDAYRSNSTLAAQVAPEIDRIRQGHERAAEQALRNAIASKELTQAEADQLRQSYELGTERARHIDLLRHLRRATQETHHPLTGAIALTEEMEEATEDNTEATTEAESALERLTDEYGELLDVLDEARRAVDQMTGGQAELDAATISLFSDMDTLTEGIAESEKEWNLATEAGRDNMEQARRTAESIRELELAMLENGSTTQEAAAAADAHREQLREVLLQAGLTEEAVDLLMQTYAEIPDEVMTAIHADTNGALQAVDTLQAELDAIHGRNVHATVSVGLPPMPGGGSPFYDKGGRPPIRRPFVVGESGPEVMEWDSGGLTVHSANRTRSGLAGGGGGGMINELHVHVDASADLTNPDSARQWARVLRDELITLEREDA